MKVPCEIRLVELDGDGGATVESVEATCPECDHCETAYGTGEASVKRALVMLRENCPRGMSNFYFQDED